MKTLLLVLAVAGCATTAPPPPPPIQRAGYAPAYPPYVIPLRQAATGLQAEVGARVLKQGEIAVCQ